MADFKDIIDIKPVLQNTKSVEEQAAIIKERFPDKYDLFEEDGDLVIVDRESGEEAVGPKFLATGEDYYSPEAIADRQKTAENKLMPPPEVTTAAGALAGLALAPETGGLSLAPMLKGAALGNIGGEVLNDPKSIPRNVLPLALALMGGSMGSALGKKIGTYGTKFVPAEMGTKIPEALKGLSSVFGAALGAGGGGGTGKYLANQIDDKEPMEGVAQTAVESSIGELLPRAIKPSSKISATTLNGSRAYRVNDPATHGLPLFSGVEKEGASLLDNDWVKRMLTIFVAQHSDDAANALSKTAKVAQDLGVPSLVEPKD